MKIIKKVLLSNFTVALPVFLANTPDDHLHTLECLQLETLINPGLF